MYLTRFERPEMLANLKSEPFDVLVIGGGATGLGCAVDAATRGYRTALVEAHDFAKGTSSRSTKLVHGGVRYLENFDFGLVAEALDERATMAANAPHIVHDLKFIVPRYQWWEGPFYGIGLKLYDALAGKRNLGSREMKPSQYCAAFKRMDFLAALSITTRSSTTHAWRSRLRRPQQQRVQRS